MNTVAITGRVAKDPESRSTVTTDRVKLKDGKTYVDESTGYTTEETEFHKVTCSTVSARPPQPAKRATSSRLLAGSTIQAGTTATA